MKSRTLFLVNEECDGENDTVVVVDDASFPVRIFRESNTFVIVISFMVIRDHDILLNSILSYYRRPNGMGPVNRRTD
jgi:predicted ATP-grasp superfamily ATP-dependent carboligase